MNEEQRLNKGGGSKGRWLYADSEGVVRVTADLYETRTECQEALSTSDEVLMRVPAQEVDK